MRKRLSCKFIKMCLGVAAMLTALHPVKVEGASVPSDALQIAGHYYKIIPESISWEAAKEKCEAMGGHLVTITCAEEQQLVEYLNVSNKKLWIGASRDEYFNWHWVTGEKWNYANWMSGEPNNSGEEKYASVWPDEWNDLKNNSWEQSGYICEWDDGTSFVWNNPYPVDAVSYNGNYYKVIPEKLSWTQAEYACKSMGGHLVTITSSGEQAFVEKLNDANRKLWIGAYRDAKHNWYWVTGEQWKYKNWGMGEPNNRGEEKYASVWPKKWNDLVEQSGEQSGYICEWELNGKGVTNVAPKKTKIKSVKVSSGKVNVKIQKVKSAKGYIVEYATNAEFKKAKRVTLKKAGLTTAKIKKIKKGKTYYIRVRAYAKGKGTTLYSPWSAVKKVKIKK